MQYQQFGKTGLFVSRLCLGTGTFGKARLGTGISQAEADRMVGQALDAGINLFDTSDVYGGGEAEVMLGKALGKRRREAVVATKAHARTGQGPNDVGQSRVHLMQALERSLKELGTDCIDLYQMHQPDPYTRFEESLRTLDDAIRQGKVRYIGCSNLMAWQVMQASKVAALNGFEEFASIQAYYSVAGRDIEREIAPLAVDQKLALLIYSPLAGALLTGAIRRDKAADPGTRRSIVQFPPVEMDRAYAVIDVLEKAAARHGATVPRVALAWLLHRPFVTSVIIGARTAPQLQENILAAGLELTAEDLKEIDAASRLPVEYPSWSRDLSAPREPLTGRVVNRL